MDSYAPNDKHSLEEQFWYLAFTTSTEAPLKVARLGWFPPWAKVQLYGFGRRTGLVLSEKCKQFGLIQLLLSFDAKAPSEDLSSQSENPTLQCTGQVNPKGYGKDCFKHNMQWNRVPSNLTIRKQWRHQRQTSHLAKDWPPPAQISNSD